MQKQVIQLASAFVASLVFHAFIATVPFGGKAISQAAPKLSIKLPALQNESGLFSADTFEANASATPPAQRVRDNNIITLSPVPETNTLPSDKHGLISINEYKRPRLLNPEWLDESWRFPSQVGGRVTVSLVIDSNGKVLELSVEGGASEFADWLLEEFPKQSMFAPAKQNGIPVEGKLKIVFDLQAVSR